MELLKDPPEFKMQTHRRLFQAMGSSFCVFSHFISLTKLNKSARHSWAVVTINSWEAHGKAQKSPPCYMHLQMMGGGREEGIFAGDNSDAQGT